MNAILKAAKGSHALGGAGRVSFPGHVSGLGMRLGLCWEEEVGKLVLLFSIFLCECVSRLLQGPEMPEHQLYREPPPAFLEADYLEVYTHSLPHPPVHTPKPHTHIHSHIHTPTVCHMILCSIITTANFCMCRVTVIYHLKCCTCSRV